MPESVLDSFRLDGQVAAISGATRGIGRSMAIALGEAGADVALLQRSVDDLDTATHLRSLGRRVEVIGCDFESRAEVLAAVPEVVRRFGSIDILVNCAGIQRRAEAIEFSIEDWDLIMQVNLTSTFLLSQQAGKYMLPQGHGKIINIASILSFQGGLIVPAYAASKGGVAQLTKSLSNEWAGRGVNVNAIAPGYVATEMNTALIRDPLRSEQILDRVPAGRWGAPEDFKGMVVFLASRASNYVHGTVYNVDGGYLGR